MAYIDTLVRDRASHLVGNADHSILVSEIDTGLFNAGVMVEAIRDLVLHPIDSTVDVDCVSAHALALLAYLGQLGTVVDALERYPLSAPEKAAKGARAAHPRWKRLMRPLIAFFDPLTPPPIAGAIPDLRHTAGAVCQPSLGQTSETIRVMDPAVRAAADACSLPPSPLHANEVTMQPYSDRLRGFLTTRPGIAQRSPALLTAKPVRVPSLSPIAERIADAMYRQHDAVARANVLASNAKLRIELLSRMAWRIPLHEWSEAKRRGADAVRLLLEAYMPGNESWMASVGLTPRCPPWASRRYRAPVQGGELVGARAGASL